MKNYILTFLLGWSIILLSSFIPNEKSSTKNSIQEDTRSSYYFILDNRFEGKSDAFLDLFNATVTYPEEAKENCRMGLSKISFNIDKEGKMSDIKFNQQLGFGIDKALNAFLDKIKDKWKAGNRASEFEMEIGFRIKNGVSNYRPEADIIVTATPMFRFSTGDTTCGNTEDLFKKMNKFIKKKKYSKAQPFVEELLRRFPADATIQQNNELVKNSK